MPPASSPGLIQDVKDGARHSRAGMDRFKRVFELSRYPHGYP
jgi:hypothetical protein